MSSDKTFSVRIWGARGTMASLSSDCEHFGGNTACVEVRCGDERLIFDAGSGLRLLGDVMMSDFIKQDKKGIKRKRLHLFFTHCHYDHISGFPFFAPFFDRKTKIDIWSGHLEIENKTEVMIKEYMRPPFFPVGPDVFAAKLRYRDFDAEDTLKPAPGIRIETISLDHHDRCVGYRVNFAGRSFCYITDTTHDPDKLDEGIIRLCEGTDLMVYDGTYTDEEFPYFANFGHSTWEEGVRLAKAANVKRYCIFHHRPSRTDKALHEIEDDCRKMMRRSWVAREGLTFKL